MKKKTVTNEKLDAVQLAHYWELRKTEGRDFLGCFPFNYPKDKCWEDVSHSLLIQNGAKDMYSAAWGRAIACYHQAKNLYRDGEKDRVHKIEWELKELDRVNRETDIYRPDSSSFELVGLPCNAITRNGDQDFSALEKLSLVIIGITADNRYVCECTGHEHITIGGWHYHRDELKGARYTFEMIVLKDYPKAKQPDRRKASNVRQAFDFANQHNLAVQLVGSLLWIAGNTFQYRHTLKGLGGRWCPSKNAWKIG